MKPLESLTSSDALYEIQDSVLIRYTGSGLQELTVPEGVTEIGPMAFAQHHELRTVRLPYSLVRIGEGAFRGCCNLQHVQMLYLDKADSRLLEIGAYAFADCSALKRISIPNSVQMMQDYVFENCAALRCVNIPSSIRQIGIHCFLNCPALETLQLPVDTAAGILDLLYKKEKN